MDQRRATVTVGLFLLIAGLVLAATLLTRPDRFDGASESSPAPTEGGTKQTVQIELDFGDGRTKRWDDVAWSERLTVLDALQVAAERHGLRFEYRGRGATAFVESLEGVANTGNEKNWIYRVNGEKINVGAGVYRLQPGDVILWKFTDER